MSNLSDILNNPKQLAMIDMFDIRKDIEKALRNAGFEVTGAGTCSGGADISVKRDGVDLWIDIKNLT